MYKSIDRSRRTIDFLNPDIRWSDIFRAVKSIRSGWLVPGSQASFFEDRFAGYLGAEKSYLTSSATASVEIALLLAGVGPGDEVICASITWVSPATSILWLGAKPIFCDVNRDTYLIDADSIRKLVTPKTKAIIVTHLYGQMADMNSITQIAAERNIKVIEDAAHAIESSRDGIKPGQESFAACFSFHAAKNITSGQGGALIIEAPQELVKLARRCGVSNNEHDERIMSTFGGKFDLTDFQAALLLGQLERIEKNRRKRETIFEHYEEMCRKLNLKFPHRRRQDVHAYHQFTLEVEPIQRRPIRKFLRDRGISTSIHFRPVHKEPFFSTKGAMTHLPNAEIIGERTLSLPTHTKLTLRDLRYIEKNLSEGLLERH